MRPLTEDEEERLAEQGRAHLAEIQGTGRPWALRLAAPSSEWFDQLAERLDNDAEWFDRATRTWTAANR